MSVHGFLGRIADRMRIQICNRENKKLPSSTKTMKAVGIKDFTLLNSIERLPNGNFKRRDLDFINTQLLSLGQAAVKMRELAASADPNLSLQFRARTDKMTEYNSRKGGNFGDYLNESARIIEFAVNEIRNNQRFDLTNIQFSKTIL